jgi:hypothetical protein
MKALEKYNIEKDIAAYIKKEFDKKYGPTWHCIVGRNFGAPRGAAACGAAARGGCARGKPHSARACLGFARALTRAAAAAQART